MFDSLFLLKNYWELFLNTRIVDWNDFKASSVGLSTGSGDATARVFDGLVRMIAGDLDLAGLLFSTSCNFGLKGAYSGSGSVRVCVCVFYYKAITQLDIVNN